MTGQYILSIDQGTTSTRAILFDMAGSPVKTAQQEHRQIFPSDGWVEHDPEEIWTAVLKVAREVLEWTRTDSVVAIGITNQRETTVLWDRKTGIAVHNAIVWQDRRTAPACARLREQGLQEMIATKTGLLPDPYFSGTKLAWLLDNVPGETTTE
jgi:glycerol kinase